VTKWNQRIPKIRRWQFMWNASNSNRFYCALLLLTDEFLIGETQ